MAERPDRRSGFYDQAAETMPPSQRRALQENLLRMLVPYCYEGSSTYREKMRSAGITPDDIQGLEDLPKIPVTRKRETADLRFEGIQVVPYHKARRIFVSPGPQFYAYGPIPQEMNPLARVFWAVGFRPEDIVLNTFSYHLTPAGISFDEALGAFGCCVIPAGPHHADLQAEILAKLPVTGYVGTPSFLQILSERITTCSLEVALTSAEPLTPRLRTHLESRFGWTVRQLYGSADGLLPCFECWAADGMHVPDLMIVELTDPRSGEVVPPGQPGEVTATVYNPYRPLLRFANGDLARLTDEPCVCGRTSPRLYFLGRVDEATKVRGMFLYPEEVEAALAGLTEVRAWQVVVERDPRGLDDLILRLVAPPQVAERAEEAFRSRCRLRARVEVVGSIPAGAPRIDDRRRWES